MLSSRVALGSFVILVLAGCVTTPDTVPGEPVPTSSTATAVPAVGSDGLPMYRALPSPIESLTLEAFGDSRTGVRMKLWEDRAYVTTGNATDGVAIFDITDPFAPIRLGSIPGISPREGLGVLDYGQQTVLAVSAGDLVFYDVTDPSSPEEIARIDVPSHTLGVYREGFAVYNAGWTGAEASSAEIVDARDPKDIKLEKLWNWGARAEDGTPLQPSGCHDIVVDQANARAYCASQGQTMVWDLKDPFTPRVVTVVTTPTVPHHNTAFPILGGKVLAISQEEAGCGPTVAGVASPAGLWFYDLTVSPPAPLSWWSMDNVDPDRPGVYGFCAPHFGSELGDTGFVVFSWFEEGIVLVDASDPTEPKFVSKTDEGGKTEDAMYYRGLVFAAGEKGGLQVAVPE